MVARSSELAAGAGGGSEVGAGVRMEGRMGGLELGACGPDG